ncbi:MAG TPA: glycosyl hydrolase family protein [Pseudomonadales bacterium]|nr:glycosyl hydrolase family protein [Pseudomonadales bacterium]
MSHAQSVVNIELLPQQTGPAIDPDFVGLSFEMRDVLADTNGNHFFSPTNKKLIATFKQLGIKNLRVGGSTADRPTLPVPSTNDVDSLFSFAKRADVKVIYTLRLKHGDPKSMASMAYYIKSHYAKQLDCFVIGNEPNTYYSNFPAFFADWKFYAGNTELTNLPKAIFCGPSVSPGHEKWSAQFATELASSGFLKFISQHDYPGGDARKVTNAATARDKILLPAMEAHYAAFASHFVPVVVSSDLPYRFEEANSFYDGGALDVSDTFASALWALNYQWWWAENGILGVNFHTGDKVAAHDESKPCRYATFWTVPDGYNVHPVGYAEKMFSLGSNGRIVPVKVQSESVTNLNFAAYAVSNDDKNYYITLINKSHDATATNLSVAINANGIDGWSKGKIIRLAIPKGDISRKTGMTLGGAEIMDDGKWEGQWQMVPCSKSQPSVEVNLPAASAAVIKLTPQ